MIEKKSVYSRTTQTEQTEIEISTGKRNRENFSMLDQIKFVVFFNIVFLTRSREM